MDLDKNNEELKTIDISKYLISTSDHEDSQKDYSDNSPRKLSMNDFKVIRILGKGSYAKVVYAKHIINNKNYAIKIIDKTFIEREEKVEEVHIERQLLSNFSHPNIVKLYYTFQNKKKLYFVLEFAEKGDLKEFITTQSTIIFD